MTKKFGPAFLILSVIYLASLPWALPFAWLLKVGPIALLAVAVWQASDAAYRPALFAALLFSACGDILLELDWFIAGVAAFLLAQACYALLFFRYRSSLITRWPGSLLLAAYIVLMAIILMPHLGELIMPVLAYLAVISLMGFLALQSSRPLKGSVAGALVFISSDSLIAINKFLTPIPLASVWIMVTYYAAQWLLISGFLSARTDR